jgi:hypothetical protein
MIFSISFLNRFFVATCLSLLLTLSGCAAGSRQDTLPNQPGLGRVNIAVLPLQNQSGATVPLKTLRQSLVDRLQSLGFSILADSALDRFMAAHRMRYTGGIDSETAEALKSELGVDAVLITDIELYDEKPPPKIAILSRLVSTAKQVPILWIDSVSIAGDESMGVLGLGLIEDPEKLREKALERLTASIASNFSGKTGTLSGGGSGYIPRAVFGAPALKKGKRYTIAVVPFTNRSARRNAGDFISLALAEKLVKSGDFDVVEPGIVRQNLLNMRLVMPEGISISDIELLFTLLDTDLVLIGSDFEYQDPQGSSGTVKVEFSMDVIYRTGERFTTGRIIWSSRSHNEGDDYIYAFDWGKVYTAHELTSRMTARILRMFQEKLFSDKF